MQVPEPPQGFNRRVAGANSWLAGRTRQISPDRNKDFSEFHWLIPVQPNWRARGFDIISLLHENIPALGHRQIRQYRPPGLRKKDKG
jgi:hypothetical protein